MPERPNILYIFTDQQSALAMSCAGNADLATPAMDRLAARGVRFARAYCTQPLCSPCRASMFTGLMPAEAGVPRNGMPLNDRARAHELGVLMANAGYDCAYGGKWHIPEGSIPEGHGFRPLCRHNDHELADACVRFLGEAREAPFFLVASFDNPHNICEWARNQRLPWGPIPEPASVAECPNLPLNFSIPPYEPEALRFEQARNRFAYPVANCREDDWRRLRWAYYRLVEKVDAEIGRILDALADQGLEDDTLVIFSSDHGDGHGAHAWNQKSALYEEIVRVPLIVAGPGVRAQPEGDRTHLASIGLDLLPTVCDYGGAPCPEGLAGRSLRPLLEGAGGAWRDEVVIDTSFDGVETKPTLGKAVVTERYKYAVYNWGQHREQLFDLEEDPGEMRNLAVEARYASVLDDHRRRLHAWMQAHPESAWWRVHVPGYYYA